MSPVDRLVLTARVAHYQQPPQKDKTGDSVQRGGLTSGKYVAWVDGIDVQVEGESADLAREELIQAMLSWISARDCTDSMVEALTQAGFPEINDDTELHLEFQEPVAGFDGSGLWNDG